MQSAPKNLRESLTLKTNISPSDAIAQMGETLGKSDVEISKLFPGLQGFNGQVELDVLAADQNPEGPKKGDMIVVTGLGKSHVELFYGYYPNTGEVINFIDRMPGHPRNQTHGRVAKLLGWDKPIAPPGNPAAAEKFLGRMA